MHRLPFVLGFVVACGASRADGVNTSPMPRASVATTPDVPRSPDAGSPGPASPADAGVAEEPPKIVDSEGLTRCFAEAYDAADPDAAIVRCEALFVGTAWRAERAGGTSERRPSAVSVTGVGKLHPALVDAGMIARRDRVLTCLRVLRQGETAMLRVTFVIDSSGRAVAIRDAGSTFRDKRAIACALRELATLRFARPEGGTVEVVYPLFLGAAGA